MKCEVFGFDIAVVVWRVVLASRCYLSLILTCSDTRCEQQLNNRRSCCRCLQAWEDPIHITIALLMKRLGRGQHRECARSLQHEEGAFKA